MIDVVFQLIIFFVCTISMQDKAIDDSIHLAMAPNGTAVVKKDPREINVDVDKKGHISIARTPISAELLQSVLTKAVSEYGQDVPVVVRGDGDSRHFAVRAVLNACTAAGIYRIKFAAMKERG